MPVKKLLFNLFALLDDGSVKRITTTGDIQEELTKLFTVLKNEFYYDQELIPFDGRYRVEEGEIFAIDNFPIEQSIMAALENPLNVNLLQLNDDDGRIKGLFCGARTSKSIMFQVFDSRKLLSKKFTLLNSGENYSKLENPGIIIDNNLDVLILDGNLLFHSYHNARRLFDLSNYFEEATNEDLKSFSNSNLLGFEDKASFIDNADTFIRKKVALLQKNNVLKNIALETIEKEASGYGLNLNIVNYNGRKALFMPNDKKKIKAVLKFLDEDYFTGPLTGRKCVTNSKRYIEKIG